MKPEDQEALEAAIKKSGFIGFKTLRPFEKGFIAACDHRDAQPAAQGEPIGYIDTERLDVSGMTWAVKEKTRDIHVPIFLRAAPAVAINEQPTDQQLFEIAKRVIPAVERAIAIHTAAGINKKLLESLETAKNCMNSYTPEYAEVVEVIKAAKAAIRAAEASKGGV